MIKELINCVEILKEGGLILFPSDTVWGIGCDATNSKAIEKIYALKQQANQQALTCLIADDRMLKKYAREIPKLALDILYIANKPTTIIYDDAQNLASNFMVDNNVVAFRIPDDEFCFQLSRKFNGAIVHASANIHNEQIPRTYKDISPAIFKGVDYVVNLHREKICYELSSIIKFSKNGVVQVIRE